MIRRALIIIEPLKGSQHELRAVEHDAANLKAYLKSLAGGSWDEDEIETKVDWDSNGVLAAIGSQSYPADYFLLGFSGHGAEIKGKMHVDCIDKKITVEQMLAAVSPRCKKALGIFDCCRVISEVAVPDVLELIKEAAEKAAISPEESRMIFEQAVGMSEEGQSVALACGGDQKAILTSKGSLFLNQLIRHSEQWATSNERPATENIVNLVSLAAGDVYNTALGSGIQQMPTAKGARFPFAVAVRPESRSWLMS